MIVHAIGNITIPYQALPLIPSAYRPNHIVRVPAFSQSNAECYWVEVGIDGKINGYKAGSTASISNCGFVACWAI